jgi:uncharacterized protein YhaN
MRLNRLELIRYGKFTDKVLDFGPHPANGPDLHIVYGPNEAGKSTLFAGLLDFLYGIPAQSPYGFLHDYASMRLAAVVESGGRERRFVRVKKQSGLLDDQENPLGETALKGLLGGIEREDYRVMFSLDGETLKKGGRDILASKGNLGELLFAGSSGLADLSAKLAAVEKELDEFQRPGGRTGRLTELRRSAEALNRQREEADVSVRAFAQLDEAVVSAAAADAAAAAAHREATDRQERVRLLLDGLALRDEQRSLAADAAAAAGKAAALAAMLAHAPAADALADDAGAHRKALDDLPNRRSECASAEAAVRDLLIHLGRGGEANPDGLLLDAAGIAVLRDLIGRKAALDATHEATGKAAAAAARAEAESEAALAAAGAAAGPELDRMRAALDAWRAGSPTKARELAERTETTLRAALDDALERLHPWRGDAEELAAIDAPAAADVTAAGVQAADAEKAERLARQALERAEAALERQQGELAALGDPAALRDGADHGAIRAAREASWAAHRKALDAGTADAFAAAMRRDDAAMESRLTSAGAVARAGELRVSLATAEADAKQAKRAADSAAAEADALRRRFAALVAAVCPAFRPTMSPEALNGWLKLREDALRLRRELKGAERGSAAAAAEEERLRRDLRTALEAAGADADDDALPAAAEGLLRGAEVAVKLRATLERAARAAADSRAELDAASEAAAAWEAGWRDALAACWLGEIRPAPGPALAAEIIETLAGLKAALERRAERLDRLQKLERDIAGFGERVAALATAAGAPADGEPLAVLRAVIDRIVQARDAADARERSAERLVTAERALLQRLGAATMAEAEAMLAGVDAPALKSEQADLAIRSPILNDARLEAYAALTAARREFDAVGGDARAARLAGERANVLLAMGEEASRHLALRLGAAAMRQALRRYRDQHRSSMLQAASAAFAVMTRGAYAGLAAQADGGVEKLIALAGDGGSREADQLSTGTQYQLYLALRVAGYAEFARERPPPPFVCDDIFETFDDLRAEEALRLLSDMAAHGQVICLTHHRHLCAIAREASPSVRVIEL